MGGAEERRAFTGWSAAHHLRRRGYPNGYRTLCSTCNMLAARVGNDLQVVRDARAKNAILFGSPVSSVVVRSIGAAHGDCKCSACGSILPLHAFKVDHSKENGVRSVCKQCARYKIYRKRYMEKIEVFSHYGAKCACCDERWVPALTIDHIGGGSGGKKRKKHGVSCGATLFNSIILHRFPSNIRILCMNCNDAVVHYDHSITALSDSLQKWRNRRVGPLPVSNYPQQ